MEFETYDVYTDDKCVAKDMALDDAVILVKGLFRTYYNDTDLEVTLRRRFRQMTEQEVEDWE